MRLLIVDESTEDRRRVAHLLNSTFADVEPVMVDDREACALAFSAPPPDLVLTEYALSWTDGFALLRQVQERWPDVPVIMVTASGSESLAAACIRAGVYDYVPKHHLEGLIAAVRSARERREAERALGESERRLAFVVENCDDRVFLQDLDLRYVWLSKPLPPLTQAGCVGRTDREIGMPSPQLEQLTAVKQQVLQTGEPATTELAIEVAGEPRAFRVTLKPWVDAAGRVTGLAGYVRDISERRKAEEALRASERQHRELIRHAPAAILEVDLRRLRFTSVNDAMCQITGYSREELLEMGPQDLIDEEGKARLRARSVAWLSGSAPDKHVEYRAVTKHGRIITAVLESTFVTDEHGALVGATVVAHDVTERREAEQALRRSQEDLARAQAVGHLGSWRLDVRSDALAWSDEVYRIFGVPQGTPMTYKAFLEAVHPEDRGYVDAQWQAALDGAPYDIEHRIVADGQVRWVREKAYLEFDRDRQVRSGFGIVQDITERKEAEDELKRSRRRLAVELDATRRLQHLSTQLIQAEGLAGLYEQILDTAAAILQADFASLQRFHPHRGPGGGLRLLGHRGFTAEAAEFWAWVDATSDSTCGMALRTGERVIVPDVEQCEVVGGSEDLVMCRQTGIRAAQTTPLLSRAGELLGMLSTHWRTPHTPTANQLRTLDILARLAADLIERREAEDTLRRYAETLEAERTQLTTLVGELESANAQIENLARFPAENPDPILRVRADGVLLHANPASAPLLAQWGCEVGGPISEVWQAVVQQALSRGEPTSLDVEVPPRTLSLLVVPVQDAGYANLYGRDVTERKAAENRLLRYTAELETLNRANETLLQEVNHRVKNTLSAILGLIYGEKRRLLETAASAPTGAALDTLMERVRGLAAAHALLSAGKWQPLRVDTLAEKVICTTTSAVEDPQAFDLEVVPSAVRVTPEQAHYLSLILGELTMNSRKHGGKRAGHLQIRVCTELREGQVCVTYRDGGPGYPPEVVAGAQRSVGLGLVNTLAVHSLRGTWTLCNEAGAVTEICFPASPELNSS